MFPRNKSNIVACGPNPLEIDLQIITLVFFGEAALIHLLLTMSDWPSIQLSEYNRVTEIFLHDAYFVTRFLTG